MAQTPTTLAPRYFKHSLVRSDGGLIEVEKRVEYPENLRKSHVMVTGGREGSMVSGKSVPPKGEATRTGWKGTPSPGWTSELASNKTLDDSRTQAPYLRQVRPEQRAWARGVMRVSDIEQVLFGGPVQPNTRIDLDVKGTPRVELTLWIADEGLFASITGTIEAPKHDVLFTAGRAVVVPHGHVGSILRSVKPLMQYDRQGDLFVAQITVSGFTRQGAKA